MECSSRIKTDLVKKQTQPDLSQKRGEEAAFELQPQLTVASLPIVVGLTGEDRRHRTISFARPSPSQFLFFSSLSLRSLSLPSRSLLSPSSPSNETGVWSGEPPLTLSCSHPTPPFFLFLSLEVPLFLSHCRELFLSLMVM